MKEVGQVQPGEKQWEAERREMDRMVREGRFVEVCLKRAKWEHVVREMDRQTEEWEGVTKQVEDKVARVLRVGNGQGLRVVVQQ